MTTIQTRGTRSSVLMILGVEKMMKIRMRNMKMRLMRVARRAPVRVYTLFRVYLMKLVADNPFLWYLANSGPDLKED